MGNGNFLDVRSLVPRRVSELGFWVFFVRLFLVFFCPSFLCVCFGAFFGVFLCLLGGVFAFRALARFCFCFCGRWNEKNREIPLWLHPHLQRGGVFGFALARALATTATACAGFCYAALLNEAYLCGKLAA